jgi:hypothetical protein
VNAGLKLRDDVRSAAKTHVFGSGVCTQNMSKDCLSISRYSWTFPASSLEKIIRKRKFREMLLFARLSIDVNVLRISILLQNIDESLCENAPNEFPEILIQICRRLLSFAFLLRRDDSNGENKAACVVSQALEQRLVAFGLLEYMIGHVTSERVSTNLHGIKNN